MSRIFNINEAETSDQTYLRERVLEDFAKKVRPFNQSLVVKQELENYLMVLAKQYPDIDIPVTTWRLKGLYLVLKQAGGIHLRYNATVKGKTVNLNMWVLQNHDTYLALPRGQLIEEWKAQAVAV